VLGPGDQGTLGADSRIAVTRGLLARGAPAWVEGRLEFEDAPLAEVQNQLRRWYGVELRVVDSALAGRHLTASFRDEPAPRVLEIIALTLGARVELRGDTALLRPLAGIPSNR
jgi:transmembrane sensor